MKNVLRALLLAPLLHLAPALANHALSAHATCPATGDLTVVSTTIRPGPWMRKVDTDTGKQEVSVAMGVRMILAFPGTDPFVNLKLERSVAGRYAADKAAILAHMQAIARRAPPESGDFTRRVDQGIEVVALDNRTLTPGIVSMVVLFDDRHGVVATAYLMNPKPQRRAFQTIGEYVSLRNRLVADQTTCMASIGGLAPQAFD